jgi:putative DNA primase/helicase
MNSAAATYPDLTEDTIEAALLTLDPNISREKWARIAMALKSELGDGGFSMFDSWSQSGDNYNPADCRSTWKSVRPLGGVNIGTLIYEAQQQGFQIKDGTRPVLSPEEIETRRRKREEEQAQGEAERKRIHGERAKLANLTWSAAHPATPDHPYLHAKRVRAHGLAIGEWPLINDEGEVFRHVPGALLVPIMDAKNGKIISLQGVWEDYEGKVQKRYLKGARKSGGCLMIGQPPKPGDILVFCEGYATGATIHELTGWTVIVAFDAPNVPTVAKILREAFPQAAFVFCADNDVWSTAGDIENPGVHYAQRAAQATNGLVLVPQFQDVSSEPTDFNDLAALEGDAVARAQLLDNPITGRANVVAPVAANDNVDIYSPLVDVKSNGKPRTTIENVQENRARMAT